MSREKIIAAAKAWLGLNEADGSFREIIDLYNSITPLPVGYKVKYTDEWCAIFISALFAKAGLLSIGFAECSCERMISLYKAVGRWQERDDYVPQMGDLVMYDWQDNGIGDAKGWADHVGIVAAVDAKNITVIEGNRNNAVGYRQIAVDARYIRGYCLPDYESVDNLPVTEDEVTAWAVAMGLTDGSDAGAGLTKRDLWAALRIATGGQGM